jgi:NAD-reducing hydrogenase small subunit
VNITLVEGSVSSEDDLEKIKKVRAHTDLLVSLGDCAVTGNIPGMRNPFGVKAVLTRSFVDTVTIAGPPPRTLIPALLDRVRPVHEVVAVDVYLPGCPPSAELILHTLECLLAGRHPQLERNPRFGA